MCPLSSIKSLDLCLIQWVMEGEEMEGKGGN